MGRLLCGALTLGLSEGIALEPGETRVRRLARLLGTFGVVIVRKSVAYVGVTWVRATAWKTPQNLCNHCCTLSRGSLRCWPFFGLHGAASARLAAHRPVLGIRHASNPVFVLQADAGASWSPFPPSPRLEGLEGLRGPSNHSGRPRYPWRGSHVVDPDVPHGRPVPGHGPGWLSVDR